MYKSIHSPTTDDDGTTSVLLIYFDTATCRYYNNGIIIKIMAIIKLRQLIKKNAVSVKAN